MSERVGVKQDSGELRPVKVEVDVLVEVVCAACGALVPASESCDAEAARAPGGGGGGGGAGARGASLYACLCRRVPRFGPPPPSPQYLCLKCADLIELLERTELEYFQLKQSFEEIISRNPLYSSAIEPPDVTSIKNEETILDDDPPPMDMDSEDEPLVMTKRRKPLKNNLSRTKEIKLKKKKYKWVCGVKDQHIAIAHVPFETEFNAGESLDSQLSNNMSVDSEEIKIEIEDEVLHDLTPLLKGARRGRGRPRKGEERGGGGGGGGARGEARDKVLHKCDQCDAKFTSVGRLRRHARAHDAGPPYICEVCGAHYKHRRACDIHIALHKGISDWKCEECDKLFPSKGALHRHNNIHTGKANYQCDQCGKSFIHTSSFKMHKLAHSGVKPHACALCGLQLMTSSHLKRHLRVHSGEKRYHCAHCGKKFSERYNLAAHAKSHEPAAAAADLVPAPERKKHFRCTFCFERYERKYMLERHCQSVHGRPMERPAPRPRNTMSKLLRQRAGVHALAPDVEIKQSSSPPATGVQSAAAAADAAPPPAPPAPSAPPAPPAPSAWSDEFTRLHQYPH